MIQVYDRDSISQGMQRDSRYAESPAPTPMARENAGANPVIHKLAISPSGRLDGFLLADEIYYKHQQNEADEYSDAPVA